MSNFKILLLLFLLIVFSVLSSKLFLHWKNIIENYENNKTILFLGDSILKNDAYVERNENVAYLVKERIGKNVKNYAIDGVMIIDVHNQIKNIPEELNKETTYIFLSIGGNDILNNFVYNNDSSKTLYKMFDSYKHVVEKLQSKMDKAKIILLNIYYPKDEKLEKYQGIIHSWNKSLRDFYYNKNNIYILDLTSIFRDKRDFTIDDVKTYFIEPSASGSKKISAEIVDIVARK